MRDVDITEFFYAADPATYSASPAELGENAGRITWRAACDADFSLLQTPEQRAAFREFVESSGGWNAEEISAWTDSELNALCIQWVSGDMREGGLEGFDSDDWEEYQAGAEAGQYAGRIFRGDDGRIYWSMG